MADGPAPDRDPVQDAEDLARWMFWRAQRFWLRALPYAPPISWAMVDEHIRDSHRVIAEEITSGQWRAELAKVRADG